MSNSAIVTSLLYLDVNGADATATATPHTFLGKVIGVQPTATTYLLGCPSGDSFCDNQTISLTLGPWASQTLPSGAAETGVWDAEAAITAEDESWIYSYHCDMSRSIAQDCIVTKLNDTAETTSEPPYTISGTDLDDRMKTFAYITVTLTAGQELLAAATSSASAISDKSESAQSTGTKASASTTSGADAASSPTKTSGSVKHISRAPLALFVAGIALGLLY